MVTAAIAQLILKQSDIMSDSMAGSTGPQIVLLVQYQHVLSL